MNEKSKLDSNALFEADTAFLNSQLKGESKSKGVRAAIRAYLDALSNPKSLDLYSEKKLDDFETKRENLLKKAKLIHDENCKCDPKYIMSCSKMTLAIFQVGKEKNNKKESI